MTPLISLTCSHIHIHIHIHIRVLVLSLSKEKLRATGGKNVNKTYDSDSNKYTPQHIPYSPSNYPLHTDNTTGWDKLSG